MCPVSDDFLLDGFKFIRVFFFFFLVVELFLRPQEFSFWGGGGWHEGEGGHRA